MCANHPFVIDKNRKVLDPGKPATGTTCFEDVIVPLCDACSLEAPALGLEVRPLRRKGKR